MLREEPGQEPAPAAPQPTLSDIPRLVEETRRAGAKIDFEMRVDARRTPRPARWVATPTASCRRRSPTSASTPAARRARVRVTGAADRRPARQRPQPPARPRRTPDRRCRVPAPACSGCRSGSPWPAAPWCTARTVQATSWWRPSCHGERAGAAGRRRRAGARRAADDPVRRPRTCEVVGEADDGARAVAAVRAHRPDVVLMDIRMPEMDGIAATAALRRLDAPPQVIVLTTFQADEQVMSALRAGARRVPAQGHPARGDRQRRAPGRRRRRDALAVGHPHPALPLRRRRRRPNAAAPPRSDWPRSPTGSVRSRSRSGPAPPTPRWPPRCS